MSSGRTWTTAAAVAVLAALLAPGPGDRAAPRASAAPAAAVHDNCPPPRPRRPPPPVQAIAKPRWVPGVLITEYYPAPERWFDGRLVRAPGLPGRYRVDWLYSARGLAMQGHGIGRDGRWYRFAGPYSLTWRDERGRFTLPCRQAPGFWSQGRPKWIGPTWLNARAELTYPRPRGGWSNGPAVRRIPAEQRPSFGTGPSLPIRYWRNVAVDPRLIPRGSAVFVPAYCGTPSRGWFTAGDTGGAILGRHIDVYRAPPAKAWDSRVLRGAKIYVVPPGYERPAGLRCARR